MQNIKVGEEEQNYYQLSLIMFPSHSLSNQVLLPYSYFLCSGPVCSTERCISYQILMDIIYQNSRSFCFLRNVCCWIRIFAILSQISSTTPPSLNRNGDLVHFWWILCIATAETITFLLAALHRNIQFRNYQLVFIKSNDPESITPLFFIS